MIRSAIAACIQILEADVNVPVATKAPKTTPAAYVRVSRLGGGLENKVTDRAWLLIECWAQGGVAAEQLSNTCREALAKSIGKTYNGTFIRHWQETGGPVDFDDDESEMSRYQFHGSLHVPAI